ncbi:MAG: hypothetical protein ACF8GE_12110 [Phycisphaerales bacterium JB043]
MEYLVTLRNPTSGETRRVNVDAATTGQALAKLGRVPDGFAIDSVRAAEDLSPPPLLHDDAPEEEFVEEDEPRFDYKSPTGTTRAPRATYQTSTGGSSMGSIVFAWIFGAIVGAGTFWMPTLINRQNTPTNTPVTTNPQPITTRPETSTSSPIASNTTQPTPTGNARRDELSGTVWGLDQGEMVPLAIWRVTGQDPTTRFHYEALVAADSEPEARALYEQWSPNSVISIERVAWLRGSPDGSEP